MHPIKAQGLLYLGFFVLNVDRSTFEPQGRETLGFAEQKKASP